MKVKISEKQYVMIEKMARTKVALNPQWWSVGTINVVDTGSVCKRYEDCVSTNLRGLLREAMEMLVDNVSNKVVLIDTEYSRREGNVLQSDIIGL